MTRPLRSLLLLACLALGTVLLAACGGGDEDTGPTPAEVLRETFRSSGSAIDDGRLNLSFRLDPEGLLAVGGPVKFTLDGPFRAPRTGDLTRFDLDVVATLAEKEYGANVLSTGTKVLVTLDDGTYRVDDATVARLRRSSERPASLRGGVPVVGFDPLGWIRAPKRRANERVAGVDTIHIGGRLDVVTLLAELDDLLRKAGGSHTGSALLAPKLRRQIAAATESSTVDIWTGANDKVLRQLAVRIVFFFKDGSSPLQALNGGTINLRLRLEDVNEQAEPASAFAAPEGARTRPLAELTGGGPENILKGVGAGLTGGKGRELFACLTAANASSPKLVRCVSKLAR